MVLTLLILPNRPKQLYRFRRQQSLELHRRVLGVWVFPGVSKVLNLPARVHKYTHVIQLELELFSNPKVIRRQLSNT